MDEEARINAGLPPSSNLREWPKIKPTKGSGKINGAGWLRTDLLPLVVKWAFFGLLLIACGMVVYSCA